MKITKIFAIEILDSRGNPTLETYIELNNGIKGKASVPSGASTGKYEALELRDGDKNRFGGKGVLKATANVNEIIGKRLCGMDIEQVDQIDREMIQIDGTKNKSKLGANSILSVSLAAIRALSNYKDEPVWQTINQYYFSDVNPDFPRLMVNIINGGKHANWNFDIQEFMISPKVNSPSKAARISSEIFHSLGTILKNDNYSTLVGDEGGYSPSLTSNKKVFEIIIKSVNTAGFKSTIDVDLAIDVAASHFFKDGFYFLKKEGGKLTTEELINYYLDLRDEYPIFSLEDHFAEDDWDGFKKFTDMVGDETLTVGDDLYTTNIERIKRGVEEKTTNAILIKPNQIGTVLETVEAIKMAKKAGWKIIISNRSGETEDPFIADLAVACKSDFIKSGSVNRSERLVKYNRLIEIEKLELNQLA